MDQKLELERAYRALRALYGEIANGERPGNIMLSHHGLTIGASIRFVEDGELDGAQYFEGKPVSVLHEALRRVVSPL